MKKGKTDDFLKAIQKFNLKYVDVLFWLFPVVLLIPGFFHPQSPQLYFESFIYCSLFLEAWLIGGGMIFWKITELLGSKLQTYKKFNPLVKKEIFGTTMTVITISSIAAWPITQVRLGQEIVFSWKLNQSFSFTLIQFIIFLFATDAFTYWKHWFLHRPYMFPFHKFHHAFHDPSTFASFSFHPVDAFFTFSPIYLAMINQIQISAQMYVGYILFFVHINLYMHSGYSIRIFDQFLSFIWITSSETHNIHHEKSHCNFGEVSPLWDHLNSTYGKTNSFLSVEDFVLNSYYKPIKSVVKFLMASCGDEIEHVEDKNIQCFFEALKAKVQINKNNSILIGQNQIEVGMNWFKTWVLRQESTDDLTQMVEKKSPREVVKEKILKSPQYQNKFKDEKELNNFCQILSSKKLLKENYFHHNIKGFEKLDIYNSLNSTNNYVSEEDDDSSDIYASDEEDYEEEEEEELISKSTFRTDLPKKNELFDTTRSIFITEKQNKEEKINVDLKEVDGMIKVVFQIIDAPVLKENGFVYINSYMKTEEEVTKENQLKDLLNSTGNCIKIKLVLSEATDSAIRKFGNSIMAPVLSKMGWLPEYGLLHPSLIIGPWKLEWNTSELVIPRPCKSSESIFCVDIYSISTLEELNEIIESLVDIIIEWNTSYTYKQTSGDPFNDHSGNCQQFIDYLINILNLTDKVNELPEGIHKFLGKIRERGVGIMEFEMNEKFRTKFNINESKKVFTSHKELDEFVNRLISKDFLFFRNFVEEGIILKSFDRAFWLRFNKTKEDESCKPLSKNNDFDCPFKDPKMTNSILDFSRK
eukprot:gene2928-4767_t